MTKQDWKRIRDYFKDIEKHEVGGEIKLTEINCDMNFGLADSAEPMVFISFIPKKEARDGE